MKHSALVMKGIDEAARAVDCLASSAAIDSYDEIVEQDWILDRYKTNPVVLFGHNSRDLPIGRAENVRVTSRGLEARIVFASAAANPQAEKIFQLVKEKVLTGISVGFVPGDYRFEKRDGKEVVVLSKNVLHELSVVPIPANPEALIAAKSAGLIGASVVTSEYVRWLEDQPASMKLSTSAERLIEKGAAEFPSAASMMGTWPATELSPEAEAERALGDRLPRGENNASLRAAMISVEADRIRGRRRADDELAALAYDLGNPGAGADFLERLDASRRREDRERAERNAPGPVTADIEMASLLEKMMGGAA